MFERLITLYMGKEAGTSTGDFEYNLQFSFPVKIKAVHAVGSNANDATIAFTTGLVLAATAVGDSDTYTKISASSFTTKRAAKDTKITIAVVYGDVVGTAIDDLEVVVELLTGEG